MSTSSSVVQPLTGAVGRPEPALPTPPATGPIVVATVGAEESDAVVRLALPLGGRTHADVQVVTAIEPAAPVDVLFTRMPPPPGELRAAQRDAQLAAVRAQLHRAAPNARDWPVAAVDGPADEAIARFATERGARVVLVGRGRHGVLERVLSGETVLRLLRRTEAPVYAVAPDAMGLPRRVVVATDFSPYSIHAARVALALAAPDAEVTLAHVNPRLVAMAPGLGSWEGAYDELLPAMFARARAALDAPEGVRVKTVAVTGHTPGSAVIALLRGADLVVSGTHGHGFVSRLVLGSVAAELLRGAPCSFLCVPASARTHAAALDALLARLRQESVPSDAWEETARRLSARHAGRPCTVVVARGDDAERGVMAGLPLARFEYDPATRDVALLFGATGAAVGGPYLIHSVRDVTAIDCFVDAEGADRVVRLTGAEGEVLLRLA